MFGEGTSYQSGLGQFRRSPLLIFTSVVIFGALPSTSRLYAFNGEFSQKS
jgi:hypothetical protein